MHIGSGNKSNPVQHQAIMRINAELLSTGPLGTYFGRQILTEMRTYSMKKTCVKMSSTKWRSFNSGLNVFKYCQGCMDCHVSINFCCPKRLEVRMRIIWPFTLSFIGCSLVGGSITLTFIWEFVESFENLHRARQCHCRALCKYSNRLVNRKISYGQTKFHKILV